MEKEIQRKNIDSLFHFTQYKNLNSIMMNGIIPRSNLDNLGFGYAFNDQDRKDNFLNASCVSISHPNYKMFYRLRLNNSNKYWVVIELSQKILFEKNCAFCHFNAADHREIAIDINEKTGINGFCRMFHDEDSITRTQCALTNKYPTNPQAEVLVFDIIEPAYIKAVHFDNEDLYNNMNLQEPQNKYLFKLCSQYFYPRFDYRNWQI